MNNKIAPKKIGFLKKHFFIFLATVFFTLVNQLAFAQVNTYGFSESVSSYTALTTPSTAYAAPWDDHVTGSAFLATLGFNFTYDGVTQTQCYISPNGFISFGVQPASASYLPLSLATSFTNGGTISALGMDLISGTATDNIVYKTIGTAPNRIFVVQWTNARRKVTTGNFNFQIRLKETSNVIEISYGLCAPDDVAVYNSQVGIRGVTNDFLQGEVNNRLQNGVNNNFSWSGKTVSGIANSSTTRTSVTEYPNNGLLYTYTPSTACVTPSASATNLLIGTTTVNSTSFVGNSFTPATPAPTNYLIIRSTVNTTPTNVNIPNRVYWAVNDVISGVYTVLSNSNSTSFTQTSLTPNTTYYYWVIPYNTGCLGGPFYKLSSILSASKTTCISEPLGVVSSAVGGNSFTASWSAVTGATDYSIDVSTTNTFSALLPSYSGVSTSGATSLSITGLSPLTTYYFRVRAVGISCGLDSLTGSATTICGGYNIPYYQNFDTTTVATIPSCFTVADNNSDSISWQVQNSIAASTPNAYHLNTNNVASSNDWFFTPGLNLTAGVTYRLKFKYNTACAGTFVENLRIRLGFGPSELNMNITILDLPNIDNTVYQTATVDFTAVSSSIYYLGFQGYSFANQSKIIIDDISVIISPTCFEPTNVTATIVGSTTATVTWVQPFPAPANGYNYYVSTSSALPSDTVTPTGSVSAGITTASITGLTAATLYYVWVRGNCSLTDRSVWSLFDSFSTDCSTPALLTVTNGTLCGGGSTTLQATGPSGSVIEWYDDSSGTTLLGTGNNFVTPTLFATTNYYAQSRAPGGLVLVGPSSPMAHGGTLGVQLTQAFIYFSVINPTTLQSFDIYPMVSGQNGVLFIRNSLNVIIGTYSYTTNVAGGTLPQTLPIGLNLSPGNYSLSMDTVPASGLLVNTDNGGYPYTSSVADITGNSFDNTFYLYAYNWKFSNICRSLMTTVTAIITTPPSLTFSSASATICQGETTPLVTVSGYGAYNNFVWSTTTGVIGTLASGIKFNPTITTNYSLTASQTSGSLCTTVINYNVIVNAEPPAITVIPASPTICQGVIQPLNASLAIAVPVTILSETFNAPTNNWTTTNLSLGGIAANPAWTLRPSGYNWTSSYWNVTPISNDSSQYYFSNSDSQGSPASNRAITYLESPTFSLFGYTSASINFWHFLRYVPGNTARIEASINGGTTWTLVNGFVASTGLPASFTPESISLNSLLGNTAVKLRFYYFAKWNYGWAIDNVTITGNLALEVSWSPITELYSDSTATTPYIAGTPTAAVFAKPNTTITYTGTALGSNGCSTSNTTTITVIPSVVTGVLSGNQTICSGLPNGLLLTAFSGPIIRWEYATDASFTIGLTSIANTTSSLSTAAIGVFSGTRFYRVALQIGSCPIVYSNSVSITFPATIWNGTTWDNGLPNFATKAIFNGDFSSSSDIDACSVEVDSGNIVFNTGNTLTVQNEVKIIAGTLKFNDKASLYQVNDVVNTIGVFSGGNFGNITYERAATPMFKYDYTYWSSPVYPQILYNISPTAPFGLFYDYNNAWQNIPNPSTTTMVVGKGYICRAPIGFAIAAPGTPGVHTASFMGIPNNGTISRSLTGGAGQFNLLGNPYPSALSADAFLLDSANAATLSGTIYLWTHNTPINASFQYTGSDYAIYNYLGGVVGGVPSGSSFNTGLNNTPPNGKIASGQGFFIKGLSAGTATFKNSMRIAGNNDQFFKMTSPANITSTSPELEKHRYWLNIANNQGAFKQALFGYVESATLGLDRLFDGEMVDVGNAITLYSTVDNIKLSIQGRPLPFNIDDTIPLGYKSTINSTYSISIYDFDGLFTSQKIYLEDKLLNIIHDLKESSYTFTTEIGTFDSRFVLRYSTQTLGIGNPIFNENTVVVYKNDDGLFINSGNVNMKTVTVFDIRGRVLAIKKQINASTALFTTLPPTRQVLLIKIEGENGEIVNKKVVY